MRYRTQVIFRIGSYCLPYSHSIFDERYSGYLVSSFPFFPYGTITLYGTPFQKTSGERVRQNPGPNPTSPFPLGMDSVCPVPFSVALTKGIAIAFFSCGYIRCFNSPRFQSQTNVRDHPKIGSPIRTLRVQSLLAATPEI